VQSSIVCFLTPEYNWGVLNVIFSLILLMFKQLILKQKMAAAAAAVVVMVDQRRQKTLHLPYLCA
jgi:Gpi18-like mannosyltransferase